MRPRLLAISDSNDGAVPEARDFRELYAQHFQFVWRCLRSLGAPSDELEDAVQDVFVIVHRRLPEFRGESSIRTWLYGIVRRVAANRRRGDRSRALGPVPSELASPGPGPLECAADREAAEFVQEFLARTGHKKREVFMLAVLEQMTVPEVAAALSIPLNTAYTRLRDVRIDFQREAQRRRGRP